MKYLTLFLVLCAAVVPAYAASPVSIETVVGVVTVQPRRGVKNVQATRGMYLSEGAIITTGPNGRAFIRFGTTDLVRLKGGTQVLIAQAAGAKPGRTSTVVHLVGGDVRATLNRTTDAQKQESFAVVAGSTVCAARGTMFDVAAPPAGAAGGKVEIRVHGGTVGVGTVKSGADLGALDLAATPTKALHAGYAVTADPASGKFDLARRVAPNTSLEVVGGTGKVTAIVAGKSVDVLPGDEVPAGAKVSVAGGPAILAGSGVAVQAGDGGSFVHDAKVEAAKDGGVPVVTAVVAVTAGSAVVEAGGRTETVGAGSAAVVNPAGTMVRMSAAEAAAVLNPPPGPIASATPGAKVTPSGTTTAQPGGGNPNNDNPNAATPATPADRDDVMPELPALHADRGHVVAPPATPARDLDTVTPPGFGEPLPVSPSRPR